MLKWTKKFVKKRMRFRRVELIRLKVAIEDQPGLIVTRNELDHPDLQQREKWDLTSSFDKIEKNNSFAFVRSTKRRRKRDLSSPRPLSLSTVFGSILLTMINCRLSSNFEVIWRGKLPSTEKKKSADKLRIVRGSFVRPVRSKAFGTRPEDRWRWSVDCLPTLWSIRISGKTNFFLFWEQKKRRILFPWRACWSRLSTKINGPPSSFSGSVCSGKNFSISSDIRIEQIPALKGVNARLFQRQRRTDWQIPSNYHCSLLENREDGERRTTCWNDSMWWKGFSDVSRQSLCSLNKKIRCW